MYFFNCLCLSVEYYLTTWFPFPFSFICVSVFSLMFPRVSSPPAFLQTTTMMSPRPPPPPPHAAPPQRSPPSGKYIPFSLPLRHHVFF